MMAKEEKLLGLHFNPAGDMTNQKVNLCKKCERWADQVWCGLLPQHLVWALFHTQLLKSLEFTLHTTTLTKTKCNWIIQPSITQLLCSIGMVGTFPKQ